MSMHQKAQIGNAPDALVLEWALNKEQADALTARNAEIADELAKIAVFRDGSNSGHLEAGGYKVTVTRRFNTRWVAEKLENARKILTDELFFRVFKWKYEPHSKKDLDAFLKYAAPEFRSAILAAMETSPGSPGVKLEAAS